MPKELREYIKDPRALLDYGNEWSDWLTGDDVIESSGWSVPKGLTKVRESMTDTTTTVWVSGGVIDARHDLVNSIVTAEGRKEVKTITLIIREE